MKIKAAEKTKTGQGNKKLKRTVLTAVLIFLAAITAVNCVLLETGRTPEDISAYKDLPYFENGLFKSPEPLVYYPGEGGWWRVMLLNPHAPKTALPMERLGRDNFGQQPEELAVWWLGHSSLILELEGRRFLVDPVFGNAAPLPLIVRRYVDPPIRPRDMPPLDYVLITHDHYDHLEYAAMRALRDSGAKFVVPLGVGAHLRKWGVPSDRITELGWGENLDDSSIVIAAETGMHYSGRTFGSRNASLWASYAVKGRTRRVFISGDTGYGEHFKDIGIKHGPFDIAFIELDGWGKSWPKTHLFPPEVIRAYHDVRANALLPGHWGVFDMARHPWDESIRLLTELADKDGGVELLTPVMGQKLVPGTTPTYRWWEGLK